MLAVKDCRKYISRDKDICNFTGTGLYPDAEIIPVLTAVHNSLYKIKNEELPEISYHEW